MIYFCARHAARAGRAMLRGSALLLVALIAVASLTAIEPEEVIERMEENQVHSTSYLEGRMVITDRFGERTSSLEVWSRGSDRSLVEFTSIEDAGQKILRTSDEIYLFYPDAAELIRLQGAALRDSLLGSDVSYEDLTGNRGLLDDYNVRLVGEERCGSLDCYVIDMNARVRDIAYPRQKLWIDTADFVLRKSEQYALSGKLLKVSETQRTIEANGKIFPSDVLIEDQLKRNSRTRFITDRIDIDVTLPPGIFSLEQLSF